MDKLVDGLVLFPLMGDLRVLELVPSIIGHGHTIDDPLKIVFAGARGPSLLLKLAVCLKLNH